MPIEAHLARLYKFQVSTDNEVTWVDINGIENHSISLDSAEASSRPRDLNGLSVHDIASLDLKFTLTGRRYMNTSGGARDPGQKAIEDSAFGKTKLDYRMIDADESTVALQWNGTAKLTSLGSGGDADHAEWGCELHASGHFDFYGVEI